MLSVMLKGILTLETEKTYKDDPYKSQVNTVRTDLLGWSV
jgi:hypothetical protein